MAWVICGSEGFGNEYKEAIYQQDLLIFGTGTFSIRFINYRHTIQANKQHIGCIVLSAVLRFYFALCD